MAEALETHPIRAAFLCLPNNPTGTTIGEPDLGRLAEASPQTRIVVDEAMIYPLELGMLDLATRRPNVVVLRTFSKYFGLAGLRVGYAVGPPGEIAALEALRPPFTVTQVASEAALAALPDADFLEHSRRFFEREVSSFAERLQDTAGCRVMSALSNLVLVKFDGIDAAGVVAALRARGLRVGDAREYLGLETAECIRVSLLGSKENALLAEALQEICESMPLTGGLS